MVKGLVSNIQKYSTKDGPGIRTTVFLKGCNLNCQWCSNPETIRNHKEVFFNKSLCTNCLECTKHYPNVAKFINNEIKIDRSKIQSPEQFVKVCPYNAFSVIGEEYNPKELANTLIRDFEFYDESNGGITFSGGEPLLQTEFIIEVVKELNKKNIKVAVDTTLNINSNILMKVIPYIDLFIIDIKFIDNDMHKQYTNVENTRILENLEIIAKHKCKVEARLLVIKDINDDDIKARIKLLKDLDVNVTSIHLLAYHQLGKKKYLDLEREFTEFKTHDFDFTKYITYGESLGFKVKVG